MANEIAETRSLVVIFNAIALYGMERTVIETFDLLRPQVRPHLLMSYTTRRLELPILREVETRGLSHSFFGDKTDWPRMAKPKSLRHLVELVRAFVRGNFDSLRQAIRHDVIYLPNVQYIYLALAATLLHRLRGRRVVYSFHNLESQPSKRLRIASALVTDFVHLSDSGREAVLAAHPYLLKKHNVVIPPACGNPHFKPRREIPELHVPRRLNIVFVGQVSLHKGVDLLVDAFAEIASQFGEAVLHIVGDGDPNFVRTFEDDLVSHPAADRIHVWGFRSDVYEFIDAAHIFVQPTPPSRCHEGFGRGVVEAMSRGVPSVCFASGVLREVMVDGVTGVMCGEESAAALASSIARLLGDDELHMQCARQARERYETRFSEAYVKQAWLALLDVVETRTTDADE